MSDEYDPDHPHEPPIPPALDAEGRCLVCALQVELDEANRENLRLRESENCTDIHATVHQLLAELDEARGRANSYQMSYEEEVEVGAEKVAAAEASRDALAGQVRLIRSALYACRRAMQGTAESLTETARRENHQHLVHQGDKQAANEWYEAALASLPDTPADNFYEEDENPADIRRIFDEGEKGITAPPVGRLVEPSLNVGNVLPDTHPDGEGETHP